MSQYLQLTKFQKKIGIFLFIGILFCLGLSFLRSPYYGNPTYQNKFTFFSENINSYNAAVFGSSRMFCHFIPNLFDSLLENQNLNTFNLAIPASYNPETYYLYEKFLETIKPNQIKYAFIELQPVKEIAEENMNTERIFYWLNLKYFLFSYRYIQNSNLISNKTELLTILRKSFFYKLIHFSYSKNFFSKKQTLNYFSETEGFSSLEKLLGDNPDNLNIIKRRQTFLSDTSSIKTKIAATKVELNTSQFEYYKNEIHLQKLLEIIETSKQKGVDVIFIIPPRSSQYEELYALKHYLPKINVVDISNAEQYPLLYQSKYSFDLGHLNNAGAILFTEYVAQEIKNIL